jgi:ABC-type transporter Mla maintaining outer membrane lipid asymmetry ATPase subunit MlaF
LSGAPNIELAGVDVAHEERPDLAVLHGVQWVIGPGERWAICGEAGTGKTSLFCTGAGLTVPVAGTLRTFGRDYWQSSEAERLALGRRIGFVFDEGGRLFAHMSIAENLILPLQYHTECDLPSARARALELLASVELEEWADQAPVRLTPALRRRAALARALTQPVEVLFVDALLVGLPPAHVAWWLSLLRDLSERDASEGGPVSIVTSGFDLAEWVDWASCFGVLHGGTFQSIGEAEARVLAGQRAGLGA